MRVTKINPYADPGYAADQWSMISSSDGSKSLYGRILLGDDDDDSLAFTSDEESGSDYESETDDEGSRDGVSDIMNEAQKVIQESKTSNFRVVVHDPPIYENTANESAGAACDPKGVAQKNARPNTEQVITLTHTPSKEHDELDKELKLQIAEEQAPLSASPRRRGFFRLRRLARRIGRRSSTQSTKSEETEEPSDVEDEPNDGAYQDISVEVADDGTPLKANEKPIDDFVPPPRTLEPKLEERPNIGEEKGNGQLEKSAGCITPGYEIELEDVGLNSYDAPAEAQKRTLRRRLSLRRKNSVDDDDDAGSVSSRKSVASRISTASRRSLASIASIRSRLSFRRKKTDGANTDLDDDISKDERKRRFFARLRDKQRKRKMEQEDPLVTFCSHITDSCYFFQCIGEATNEKLFTPDDQKKQKRRRIFSKRAKE